MKYFSIDIETLGLDPDWCDVIEIAAVFDDGVSAVGELPVFHTYLTSDGGRLKGEPFAMAMHAEKLSRIASRSGDYRYTPQELVSIDFLYWAKSLAGDTPIVVAGKNFSGFDLPFLKKLGFNPKWFHHRVLDPGAMYATAMDDVPPSLKECLGRAGFHNDIPSHNATEDAKDVVRVVRRKLATN